MYMKILKKNQIIIFVLALMLVTVGYLSSENQLNTQTVNSNVMQNDISTLGDATLVNGGALVDNEDTQIEETNTTEVKDDYFLTSKLERENMYSQQLESYQKMIDSSAISSEQKAIAENEIKRINDDINAIMIIENLIKTQGFEDIVVFINGNSINAVVKAEKLDVQQISQIQNIISREMKAQISDIHISNK